jgi:hypothetical protein
MSDRTALMRALLGALRKSARPGGMLHPHLDLPRITVFDPPIKQRRPRLTGGTAERAHGKRRSAAQLRTMAPLPEQLTLL